MGLSNDPLILIQHINVIATKLSVSKLDFNPTRGRIKLTTLSFNFRLNFESVTSIIRNAETKQD